MAAVRAEKVLAIDINSFAVECAELNITLNGLSSRIDVKLGDLFEGLGEAKFGLIIFNPPYLPEEESHEEWRDKAWHDGSTGREVIDRFLFGVVDILRREVGF